MDKSELLLKNFSVLSKNPLKNADALKSIIIQLCDENAQLAIRCWNEILTKNIHELRKYWWIESYPYESLGYVFVYDFLFNVLDEPSFKYAVVDFANDKDLLNILYTRTFFDDDDAYRISRTGENVINYLLKHKQFQAADSILTAIYKNKTFSFYDMLWKNIIDRFRYIDPENYSGGGVYDVANYKQEEDVQNFCLEWVERIEDEEQKAGAMAFVMRIF